jgi:hypothetical protein
MRPKIEALDVDAMEWTPLGPPGLYSRLLSRDPETGARTALQRLSLADNYEPPKVAHFHTTYEEILGVSGLFTFDHRTWIRPCSYVFHPPRTVHGFHSGLREDSTFLSRVGRDLDVNLVHEPAQTDLYVIEGPVPPRVPVAYGNAPETIGWKDASLLGAPVQSCPLSAEPQTGEGSALVRLPAQWRAEPQSLPVYLELFVLEGGIGLPGEPAVDRRDYFFYPPGEPIGALHCARETLAYVNFGGNIGLR